MTVNTMINSDMRRGLIGSIVLPALIFLQCVSLAAAQPVSVSSEEQIAQSIEGHYRDLSDLTAKVVQKNNLKTLGKTQTFEGKLCIKKPGRLRLDYTNGQTIVLDGKNVLFYSKKSQQAIRRTFTDIEQANVPVAFLLGAAEIRTDFDVVRPKEADPRTIDLLPKKTGAAMKKVRLRSDDAGRIVEMTIYDRSGNTTDITFTEVKEGTGVDDRVFRFKIPKGTEVIEQ